MHRLALLLLLVPLPAVAQSAQVVRWSEACWRHTAGWGTRWCQVSTEIHTRQPGGAFRGSLRILREAGQIWHVVLAGDRAVQGSVQIDGGPVRACPEDFDCAIRDAEHVVAEARTGSTLTLRIAPKGMQPFVLVLDLRGYQERMVELRRIDPAW